VILFLWNVFLALIWAASTGRFTLLDLAFGFAVGFLVLWFTQRIVGPSSYFAKVGRFALFFVFFVRELIAANLRVAYDVITRTHHMRPGVVAIPLSVETEAELAALANLISLTPGTLSLDVSEDRSRLYIHAMYIEDADALRDRVKSGFERRVLELFR
jgi:multicomponent Na+:H+ antiporter subunit E